MAESTLKVQGNLRYLPGKTVNILILVGEGCKGAGRQLGVAWCDRHKNYTSYSALYKLNERELKNSPFIWIEELGVVFAESTIPYLDLFQKSLILIIIDKKGKEWSFSQLQKNNLPYLVVTLTDDVSTLITTVEDALSSPKAKFPNNSFLSNTLSLPFFMEECSEKNLKSLTISESHIEESFKPLPHGMSNRMVHRYKACNFLVVNFNAKMQPKDIVSILSKGIVLNGETFNFIGCSSSGLKERSCYMMKATIGEVESVRAECGQFTSISSIPKRMKGISLLFSNALPTSVEVRNDHIVKLEDKLSEDGRYNFTDGCGVIGERLHQQVIESAKLANALPEGYIPSVLQIRLRGFKGVVALDHSVKKDSIHIRKSMVKFECGTNPFSDVWLCNYSKPYSTGYLNKQFIMLLSALGVSDDVLLKKQQDYYNQMRLLRQNREASFNQLCIGGQHALAAKVAIGDHGVKEVQDELSRIQRKFNEKILKLRIQIQDSRSVFGICDMSEVLDYGECFFRPTINGNPHTISGKVIVAKNPSYFLGDIRVLTAVDGNRVRHLHHLIDCIVFPTKGKRPHPDEITGSDLDGDEYFVCWDEELCIEKMRNPVDFCALEKAGMAKSRPWKSCIEYMANQVNMMGLLNSYYLYWAEAKGVSSNECQQLGQLFSRSVDASKTGDFFTIPKHLAPPARRAKPMVVVWKKMESLAEEFKQQFSFLVIPAHVEDAACLSEDFILGILHDKNRKIPEFELLSVIKKWCYSQYDIDSECTKKMIELSTHINFSKLTLQQKLSALELGIPVGMVTNALNSSQLLTTEMIQMYGLTDPHNKWCFFFQATSAEFQWDSLLCAVTTYPESLVICRLSGGIIFVLHFLAKLEVGDYQLLPGSAISYLFSSSFKLLRRHVLGSAFSIDLNPDFLQLYRNGEKQNTFVWLKSKILALDSIAESTFDRISIDLTTFQKDILRKYKHPKVNKQQVDALEVFVSSGTEEPTYYDQLLSNLSCDSAESLEDDESEEVEEIQREPVDGVGEKSAPLPQGVSAVESLNYYACNGRIEEFSHALQSILSGQGECSLHEIRNTISLLLSILVKKFTHLCQLNPHLDKIVLLLASLQPAIICPASVGLFLLHKISLLHSQELTQDVGDIISSCIELNSTSEYIEVLLHWEWWYFLPPSLAKSLTSTLYSLSKSLVDKPPSPCIEVSELKEYVHHYGNLHHCSFLDEMHSNEGAPNFVVSKLKVCDHSNPHPSVAEDLSPDDGEEEVRSKHKKLEFHRNKGVTSRFDGYVIISFMSKAGSVPVTHGLITEAFRQPTNIVVQVPEPIPLCIEQSIKSGVGHWQLHCVGNVTAFVRGMKAIEILATKSAAATKLASILVHPKGAAINSLGSSEQLSMPTPTELSDVKSKFAPSNLSPNPPDGLVLNNKQAEAVMSSLNNSLTLIHGPPGTGKTRVASEIVHRYLLTQKKVPNEDVQAKVLVTAETNMAVDNLARLLMHRNINVIRVGKKEQIADDVYTQVSLENMVVESSDCRRKYTDQRTAIKFLKGAEVIATTCAGAGDAILKSFKFPFVIIDEATQVKEPISLIAITKECQQLTLIGDPEQLAPFISTRECERNAKYTMGVEGLEVTLFHRLQRVLPSVMLEEQHRMSPEVVKFPSSKFYRGMLKCSLSVQNKSPNFALRGRSIDFVHVVSSKENRMGASFKNEEEAKTVVTVVNFLINCNISPFEITVLTPYKRQAQCLIEKLYKSVRKVEVSTIDNFQGKENSIIVFSMVRSNSQGDFHFIAKRNRINVLLTRAKHYIVGVGSKDTLNEIELWKEWVLGANEVSTSDQYFVEKLSVYNPNAKIREAAAKKSDNEKKMAPKKSTRREQARTSQLEDSQPRRSRQSSQAGFQRDSSSGAYGSSADHRNQGQRKYHRDRYYRGT